jgi:hypothetical protein
LLLLLLLLLLLVMIVITVGSISAIKMFVCMLYGKEVS